MIHRLLTVLVVALPALARTPDDDPPAAADARAPRVVFIGASVTAGAWNSKELEVRRDVGLERFVDAAAGDTRPSGRGPAAPAMTTLGLGNLYFFMDPRENGERQLARARGAEPSAVVALDFLFWYAFGERTRGDPRRAAGLEAGLKALEALDCPLVLGDLPNIDHALRGEGPFGGPIVHRGMFPTEDERRGMNARIRAWAKGRGDTVVVPVSELVAGMLEGGEVSVRDSTWRIEAVTEALQRDRLHPTVLGTSWTALHVADALVQLEVAPAERFVWDGAEVARRVIELTADERARKRELDAKKEARRAAREERRRAREGAGGGVR